MSNKPHIYLDKEWFVLPQPKLKQMGTKQEQKINSHYEPLRIVWYPKQYCI